MTILIIENDVCIAKRLEQILLDLEDNISIIAVINSVKEGLDFFNNNNYPDLVFSDVNLPDGMSFELFLPLTLKPPVIFFSENIAYVSNAFDANAISYLLKPLTNENVSKALDKYHSFKSTFENSEALFSIDFQNKNMSTHYKNYLFVIDGENMVPVFVKEVAYLYLKNALIEINTLNNRKYSHRSTLEQLQQTLNPTFFFRANRHFIIQRKAIVSIERVSTRKLIIHLEIKSSEPIVVSKANVSNFLKWLED